MTLTVRICISVSIGFGARNLWISGSPAPPGFSYLSGWNKFVVDLALRYLHTIDRVSVRHLPMHDP